MAKKFSKNNLTFLQIGLGSMGKRRIRNLLVNKEHNIIGYDISAKRREEAKSKYGIEIVVDLKKLSVHDFDAMLISTPPDQHGDYIRLALKLNKHFFVEHPTSDDGYKEVFREKKSKTVKAPSCTLLFYRPIKMIKSFLEKKSIGKVLAFQYHAGQYLPDWHPYEDYRQVYFSKKSTGACREIFPFELIWLNWLFASSVSQAAGSSNKISDLKMSADDIIFAQVKYRNGIRGQIIIDAISRKAFRTLRLLGSAGVLEWEKGESLIKLYQATTKKTQIIKVPKGRPEKGYINEEEMYNDEIKAYLDAIRHDKKYPHSFKDSRQALNVLYALEKSDKNGKKILIKKP